MAFGCDGRARWRREWKRGGSAEARGGVAWKEWGPYLSERQWGTVREDYSDNGDAWSYFSHDQARSRAYKWGEDGIAGICDDHQRLCLAFAVWNGVDPILKERMFGLTNAEGNHGEDVKEYYFYLDATPTSSYLKYRYRYPLDEYPYADLLRTNASRGRLDLEYELLDTGIFDDDRYVDVDVEYAKAAPDDIHVRVTLSNRSAAPADLHLLPTLWFRNTWWMDGPKGVLAAGRRSGHHGQSSGARRARAALRGRTATAVHRERDEHRTPVGHAQRHPVRQGRVPPLRHRRPGRRRQPRPDRHQGGRLLPAHASLPRGATTVGLRLCRPGAKAVEAEGGRTRCSPTAIAEADEFYASITPAATPADQVPVMRQALAGMLWGKQYYFFDLDRWLEEHHAHPAARRGRARLRNRSWFHMINDDVISMPDTWEYPWYASWDLAFHTVALSMVDIDFAKDQLQLMLRELYLHPNGQLPAYEWNFSDVNPPVHAWATLLVYETELEQRGAGDVAWLKSAFQKLLVNFTWWINRKDPTGRNVFEGGFLGLDNIGVFDRSAPLPTGGRLEQSDGTAWMAFYAQSMLGIAVELSRHDPIYEDMVFKFAEHFAFIAAAMDRVGDNQDELWDEEDGFFYDVLRLPDGSARRLKVRSMVGLLPLCATTLLPEGGDSISDDLLARLRRRIDSMPELLATIHDARVRGVNGRRMLAVVDEIEAATHPRPHARRGRVPQPARAARRCPAPTPTTPSGSTSTARPTRFATSPPSPTAACSAATRTGAARCGSPSTTSSCVACCTSTPTTATSSRSSARPAPERSAPCSRWPRSSGRRLVSIFTPDEHGRRPVYGGTEKFQRDPHWQDLLLFYEYFHGDNGAGLGASHQTGWTGLVARI